MLPTNHLVFPTLVQRTEIPGAGIPGVPGVPGGPNLEVPGN